jgi:hypothetical protein
MEISEQVQVSANQLQMLLDKLQKEKQKYVELSSQYEAKLKAKEAEIKMYDDTIQKIKLTKPKPAGSSSKILEQMEKSKKFDEWYEQNKHKLVDEEYAKNYEHEVNQLKDKLSRMFE